MMKKKIGISKLKSFFQITFFKSSNSIKAINHQFGITHFQIKSSFHFSQSKEIKNNEKPKFEQITNSHDLASTLLSLKNTSDILTLYENNQPLFKRPDVILALKMIARSINTEDEDLNLNLDKILSKISEIIQKDVEILTPTETIDVLFSIRKLKGKNRSFVILKGQSYKILIEKINENIRKKIYSFSSLFNIYYDLSFLRSSVDVLLDRLSEEVTSNKSLITLPIILQLLQAASQKSNNIGLIFKEYVLINRLFIQLEEKYKDLKIDQKCHLFKYIAKLEMRYHPMKYEFPEFYLRLKTDIHQNLEKVNESLLMSIINAYTHLPINFPNDLLNEIKNVFIVTLQENGKNINSGFLLDFLENFQQIMNHKKKSSFKVEHFQTIVSFIIERIKSKEEIMISTKSLNSLIKIFENDEKLLKDLIDPIYDCCIQSLENKKSIFAATTLEIFLKYKKDIKPFLLQISEILTKDKLNEFFAIRIYHLLTQITLTPTLETYLEECKDMAFKLLEKEPSKFVWSLKTSRINSEIKEQLLIQSIHSLSKIQPEDSYLTNSYLISIIESCCTLNLEIYWTGYIEKNLKLFNEDTITRFLDVFLTNRTEYFSNQINLLFRIMKLSNFKAAALKKIMTLLVKNTEFFKHLCKNEQQTIFFCKALFHLYHQFGDSLKASLFFTIVRKLEDRNFESYEIFACFYKNLIKTLNTGNDRFAHKIMSEFFIEKHLASNELCKELIKIVKDDPIFLTIEFKVFVLTKYVSNDNELISQNQNLLNKYVEIIKQHLESPNYFKAFKAVRIAVGLPVKYFQKEKNHVLRVFKENIKRLYPIDYVEIISNLRPESINENFLIYEEVIIEIINSFEKFKDSLHIENLTQIAQIFLQLKQNEIIVKFIRNIFQIIQSKFRKFEISNFTTLKILQLLSRGHINNKSLIFHISTKIIKEPKTFGFHISDIMEDYFSLGTDPSLLKEFFKGVEDLPVMKNPEIIFEYLLYMVSAEDFILTEEFEKYFELMLNSKRPFKNPKMFNLNLFYAFLKTKSKEKYSINFFNYAAKHKHILDKKYDQSNSRNFEILAECLELMQIKFLSNIVLEDLVINFSIPTQKILVVLLDESYFNLDGSERGEAKIMKKIFGKISDLKIIFVNMSEFISKIKTEEKIDYLCGLGIQMDISKDQIDYLKIKHTGILSTKNYYELEGLDQVYNKLSNFSMEDL